MTNNFNYITQQISKNGTDWIAALRPEDIQRQAKRIVRDMVRGSIKYEEVGMYFLDMKFLENLIIGIKNELDINIMNYINLVEKLLIMMEKKQLLILGIDYKLEIQWK